MDEAGNLDWNYKAKDATESNSAFPLQIPKFTQVSFFSLGSSDTWHLCNFIKITRQHKDNKPNYESQIQAQH